jgi:hypothetical protein
MPSSGLCRVNLDSCNDNPGMTAFARVQVVDELGIVQRTLQTLKKGQQLVVRPVST